MDLKIFSYSWIKENYSMIILIPAVLGGIWQVSELTCIGIPFIRFFSASQLVSDGLLILIVMLGFYCYSWTGIHDFFSGKEEFKRGLNIPNPPVDNEHIKSLRVFSWKWQFYYLTKVSFIIYAIIVLSVDVFIVYYFKKIVSVNGDATILFFIIKLLALFICITFTARLFVEIHIRSSKKEPDFNKLRDLSFIFTWICTGIAVIALSPFFHKAFLLPIQIKNLRYLECSIRKDKTVSSFEVLYFNDKYIFVETRTGKGNRQIEVVNFTELLDKTACTPDRPSL